MGKFEGKIATNWPSEREKKKKGLKIDIEWLCPHAFNYRLAFPGDFSFNLLPSCCFCVINECKLEIVPECV